MRARVWVRCMAAVLLVCENGWVMGLEEDGELLVEVGKGMGWDG